MSEIIQIDRLTKTFGELQAVNNVSLEVSKGEIFGFVGLNGAGKSTTIHMMLSLLKPTSGSVYLLGKEVSFGSYELWNKVGFLENANYYSELTVEENLDTARRMQKLTDKQRVSQIITNLGLEAHAKKKAKNLSMGNKQRMGLAKALIHNPEILILDEPINGLDPEGVVEVRDMLLDLSRNFGVTVFLSSHLLEELAKLADRIGIIHKGNLIQEMKREQLEKSLKKQLVLGGGNIKAMKGILSENGYRFEENSDGLLTLSDDNAIQQPEKLNELLVRSGQSPSQLNIVSEDLEGYFLRTIQGAKGAK